MKDLQVDIKLDVAGDEDSPDPDYVDLLCRQLREEFLQLDVDDVRLSRDGQPPEHAKAVDTTLLGTLLISLSDPSVLAAVVEAAKNWVSRSQGRTARLEIDGDVLDLKGLSKQDQTRLVDLWINRQSRVSE